MNGKAKIRFWVAGLVSSIFIITSACGCNLFGPRSKPAPTRPSPTRSLTSPRPSPIGTPMRPAPTKTVPGVSATNTATLKNSITRIQSAVSKNDWPTATNEANRLGGLWTRFKPSSKGTMSATEMTKFDSNYAKLQKDVRARNKTGADRDLRALRDAVNKMRT